MKHIEGLNVMQTVNVTDWNDLAWNAIGALFDSDCEGLPFDIFEDKNFCDNEDDQGDYDLDCVWEWLHEDCETLASLEDRYGSDEIFLLPNGHVMFYDRNSDGCDYTKTPVDVEMFKAELAKTLLNIEGGK